MSEDAPLHFDEAPESDAQPFIPIYLQPDATESITAELGEHWLPVSDEIVRLQGVYGDSYNNVVPQVELQKLVDIHPLFGHPFVKDDPESLRTRSEEELDQLHDEAQKLNAESLQALKLWRKLGIDEMLIFQYDPEWEKWQR